MTSSSQSNTPKPPDALILSAESIATLKEDIEQGWGSFELSLSEGSLEVHLRDRKDTIWMVDLDAFEDALRLLKRWEAARKRRAAG